LEVAYRATERLFHALEPLISRLGYERVARVLIPLERLSKRLVFDCRMCGQCILHLTGMTCPMTCPKLLRNGPCGGVRPNGCCEVDAEWRCVWTDAYERSLKMRFYTDCMLILEPPVDWRLQGTSAWINMLTRASLPPPERC
jgi:hypothetical protein